MQLYRLLGLCDGSLEVALTKFAALLIAYGVKRYLLCIIILISLLLLQ